ncbi:MAG: class I SAM-dependent methyltransferase [Ignavibacteria bacterium]
MIKNPAFNYDGERSEHKYSGFRKTDDRIAVRVYEALGYAKAVLNVGAGAGSYEPSDRYVISVEPSFSMRSQREANNKNPAVIGSSDALPFDDKSFDASMAILTVHHWKNMAKGLQEMKRVTKHTIVIMTFDPEALDDFWNVNYFPELIEIERSRYPKIDNITKILGVDCEVRKIPVPFDCTDAFQEAFYGRPEEFLKKEIRMSQSAWSFLSPELENKYIKLLSDELKSGEWDKKFGEHRKMPEFTGALRLIIANLK